MFLKKIVFFLLSTKPQILVKIFVLEECRFVPSNVIPTQEHVFVVKLIMSLYFICITKIISLKKYDIIVIVKRIRSRRLDQDPDPQHCFSFYMNEREESIYNQTYSFACIDMLNQRFSCQTLETIKFLNQHNGI